MLIVFYDALDCELARNQCVGKPAGRLQPLSGKICVLQSPDVSLVGFLFRERGKYEAHVRSFV